MSRRAAPPTPSSLHGDAEFDQLSTPHRRATPQVSKALRRSFSTKADVNQTIGHQSALSRQISTVRLSRVQPHTSNIASFDRTSQPSSHFRLRPVHDNIRQPRSRSSTNFRPAQRPSRRRHPDGPQPPELTHVRPRVDHSTRVPSSSGSVPTSSNERGRLLTCASQASSVAGTKPG